ncbi:14688_t:CDS:2 [Funneliformis caledonium]|uniref:14688_t:CDS:1 n=1 Tax=Funneliformis caledonium TaxID=1117310 RepID=A0A9N8VN45_9GLOM|nr:14688_t:CDS:2 [Funneliformis caledonium]
MNHSSGSSVQIEIFPPENMKNKRFYTKEAKLLNLTLLVIYHRNHGIFCFVVGDDLERSFEVTGDDKMTISKLREIIYEKNKNDYKSINARNLDLWKVDIPGDTANVKLKTLQSRSRDVDKENISIQEIEVKSCLHLVILATSLNQGLIDISRKITDLGYLPRQDGLGDLVSCLAKRLEEKRVILVQAPPYSGKTSLSKLLENYLVVNSSKLLGVLRVSLALLLLWGLSVGKNCEYDTFCEVWEKIVGVEWCEWVGQCRKVPSILIIDEAQKIYKDMNEADESMKNTGTAIAFWDTIKMCLQWSNLSVIMFAAYGYNTNLYYQ